MSRFPEVYGLSWHSNLAIRDETEALETSVSRWCHRMGAQIEKILSARHNLDSSSNQNGNVCSNGRTAT